MGDDILGMVLRKLDGVQRRGGYWMARCPAHEDREASLAVARGTAQPVVLDCHAGCATTDVLAAIDLTMADISNPQAEPRGEWTPRGDAVAVYDYVDEDAKLLFQVCRAAGKQFIQRRPDPSSRSGWAWNLNGTRRVLYRLPTVVMALRKASPVYIVEGEKDAQAIANAGAVATCNPGGAGKWRPEYNGYFHVGDRVIVVADKDEPGRKHAGAVAAALRARGVAVEVVEAAKGKDAADHLAAGLGLDDFRPLATAAMTSATSATTAIPPEPWTGDLARLLDDVYDFLGRFIAYPSAHAHAAHALWIAHTHAMNAWESTPRIAFLSPEPASGKTRALEVSELLVPRPVEAVNTTPAYLFRKVSDPAGLPTILYDEIDTLFGPKAKDNEEIRGMLNAGHRRGAVAGRCVIRGKEVETEELPAYCALALAGLGGLPDTLLTRSVVVRMKRRSPEEKVEPFRRRVHLADGEALRDQLASWGQSAETGLEGKWPDMPAGVEDRDADVWEALLMIAEAAGGDWPARAREAAVALVADAKAASPSLGIRLLADIRTVWDDSHGMHTETLLAALNKLDEAPWGDLKGKPLDPRRLSWFLRDYDVHPTDVRAEVEVEEEGKKKIVEKVRKGYKREDLHDPWERYLPPDTRLRCTKCGKLLDQALVDAGFTDHGETE
jgi:hypothetical protein